MQVLLCLYSFCSLLIPSASAEAFHFSSLKQLVIAQHNLLFAFFTHLSFTPLPTYLGIHLTTFLTYIFLSSIPEQHVST